MNSTFYPRKKGAKPVVLVPKEPEPKTDTHVAAFYAAIRTGSKPPADVNIGATAALTAILGRESIYRKTVMTWRDLGIEI